MFEKELKEFLLSKGVSDVGFCQVDDTVAEGLDYAVSIVVRLSDAIVDTRCSTVSFVSSIPISNSRHSYISPVSISGVTCIRQTPDVLSPL